MMLCHSCFPLWICRFLVQRCRYREFSARHRDRSCSSPPCRINAELWRILAETAMGLRIQKRFRNSQARLQCRSRHLHSWQRYANVKRVHLPNMKLKQ